MRVHALAALIALVILDCHAYDVGVSEINPVQSTLDATNPNGASGGRVNGIAVAPNGTTFYAASEWRAFGRARIQAGRGSSSTTTCPASPGTSKSIPPTQTGYTRPPCTTDESPASPASM
jgi:hypothetical protein